MGIIINHVKNTEFIQKIDHNKNKQFANNCKVDYKFQTPSRNRRLWNVNLSINGFNKNDNHMLLFYLVSFVMKMKMPFKLHC